MAKTSDWVAGTARSLSGPVSIIVELSDGRQWHRHIDHVSARTDAQPAQDGGESDVTAADNGELPPQTPPVSEVYSPIPTPDKSPVGVSDHPSVDVLGSPAQGLASGNSVNPPRQQRRL